MKKRAWKRIISTLLIVCMLAGVAPVTQMQQVEAFDILGIFKGTVKVMDLVEMQSFF